MDALAETREKRAKREKGEKKEKWKFEIPGEMKGELSNRKSDILKSLPSKESQEEEIEKEVLYSRKFCLPKFRNQVLLQMKILRPPSSQVKRGVNPLL